MIWWALVSVSLSVAALSLAEKPDNLTPEHKTWLEEEVVYIITKQEREVFRSLNTLEERNRFIDAFWERRDPNPATRDNEFKKEHYRRLEYANRIFGRDAPRPGWKTDRGKFYIILGEPREIQRYDGLNEVVSSEIWFYQGDTRLGQPPRFNLLFFKENDVGEYELYHPYGDGPEALVRGGFQFRTNQHLAVDVLEIVSVDLARASLTVDLTDPTSGFLSARNTRQPLTPYVRPPMGVENTLARIEESPQRLVSTDYLDGYLRYRDKVTAEYSFRFVPSRQYFALLIGPQDTPFVHLSLELDPESFTLERNEEGTKFYTTLDFGLEVRDPAGTLVAVYQNTPYLELTPSQVERVRGAPFSYQDDFPLLPGDYKISVVLRNRATKQFTAGERDLRVEPVSGGPGLSPIVLGYKKELATGNHGHLAFQVGSELVYPATDHAFPIGETAYVLLQAVKAPADYRLRLSLEQENQKLLEREARVGDYDGPVLEEFSLVGMAGGNYRVQARLFDPSEQLVAERTAELLVSPRSTIPRPGFVYRHSFNTNSPGLLALARGQQLLARGQVEEAAAAFADAVAAKNPGLVEANWKLATALVYLRRPDEALSHLLPLKESHPNEPEVVEALGLAYYMKQDFNQAVAYLERSLTLRAPDHSLLNALGDAYQKLGQVENARKAFERSLELNPQQEAVKQRLTSLGQSSR
jgi:GWxTD domain-containing protein